MFALVVRPLRLLSSALVAFAAGRSTAPRGDFLSSLVESAEARAGFDPHQAYELRQAARSYLSVVR